MEMRAHCWNIGLTGGIGCGKSAVANYLEELGLRRLDTDKVARQVVSPHTPALESLVKLFGQRILLEDGSLNRPLLGTLVFTDSELRKRLEEILHPAIWNEVLSFLRDCREHEESCVVEIPLLFEKGRETVFDTVWVVTTTPELQRRRLYLRNGWSEDEIESRIASQMPLEEKARRADLVLQNDGTSEELREQVKKAWENLRTSRSRSL